MSDENESNPVSRVYDRIKDTIEKLKTLLIALGALIAAAVPVYKVFVPDGGTPPPAPKPETVCYDLKVSPHDETVSFSRAKKSDMRWFDLNVKNDCPSDLLL